MQRNFIRGQRPARPGDLTARIAKAAQQRAEAAKNADVDVEDIRRQALAEGIDAGWDRGWESGYSAAVEDFRNAGIDTDAVLALADDDTEDA